MSYKWFVTSRGNVPRTPYITAAIIQDATVEEFLVTAVIPLTPIVLYAFRLVRGNSRSIEHLENLKSILDKAWDGAGSKLLTEDLLRKVQNEIFTHRKSNFPIADKLHFRLQSQFEDHSEYNIEKMIEDLK